MGLSNFDVANIEKQISGVGDVFEQRRKDALAQQNANIEQSIRQRQLDVEMRRADTEQNRANIEAGGTIDQWFQEPGDDEDSEPKVGYFKGPPSGFQQFAAGRKAAGKEITAIAPPEKKPPVSVHVVDSNGNTIAYSLDDPKDGQKFVDAWSKAHPVQKNSFETGPSHNKASWDAENAKADALEATLKDHLPQEWPGIQAQAQTIRKNADLFYKPAEKVEPLIKLGEEPTDPKAVNPGKTYRYGTRAQATGAPTAGAPDPELQAAQAAIQAGKDPKAVKARYQQRTGKPYPGP